MALSVWSRSRHCYGLERRILCKACLISSHSESKSNDTMTVHHLCATTKSFHIGPTRCAPTAVDKPATAVSQPMHITSALLIQLICAHHIVGLPLDAVLAYCRLLHARRPSACAQQGALADCPCRHTRSQNETERWPQAHKIASSRTPGQRGDSRQ